MSAKRVVSSAVPDIIPADVYLDTSVVVAASIVGSPLHQAARVWCEALIDNGTTVYLSRLSRVELLQAVRAIATVPDRQPPSVRRRFHLQRWDRDLQVRQRWMRFGLSELNRFVGEFNELLEIPLDRRILDASVDVMCRYQVASYDATHVATALDVGVSHLLAADRDFAKIADPRLTVIVI